MAFSDAHVTRLGLYGGARVPYGSFAGKAVGEIVVVVANKKAAPIRRIKLKQIMIGNELFVIKSPEHERYLLQRYLDKQQKDFDRLIIQKKYPVVKRKLKVTTTQIVRVQNRLKKANIKLLQKSEEDEILLLLMMN